MSPSFYEVCPNCEGDGYLEDEACQWCDGRAVVPTLEALDEIDRLADENASLRVARGQRTMTQNPYACGDGGCVLLVPGIPKGPHTNAGCRCIPLRMTPDERVRLRKGIRWLAEQCTEPACDETNHKETT